MKEFKTSKAELLFVALPKDAYDVQLVEFGNMLLWEVENDENVQYEEFTKSYTLLGKLSEVSEEVAKGLVDDVPNASDYPKTYQYARHSLDLIATHLGMELTDNIYILKRI